jgi:hypothetical protein
MVLLVHCFWARTVVDAAAGEAAGQQTAAEGGCGEHPGEYILRAGVLSENSVRGGIQAP